MIKTEKLTKRFGQFTAVDGLDLEVAPGEITWCKMKLVYKSCSDAVSIKIEGEELNENTLSTACPI